MQTRGYRPVFEKLKERLAEVRRFQDANELELHAESARNILLRDTRAFSYSRAYSIGNSNLRDKIKIVYWTVADDLVNLGYLLGKINRANEGKFKGKLAGIYYFLTPEGDNLRFLLQDEEFKNLGR